MGRFHQATGAHDAPGQYFLPVRIEFRLDGTNRPLGARFFFFGSVFFSREDKQAPTKPSSASTLFLAFRMLARLNAPPCRFGPVFLFWKVVFAAVKKTKPQPDGSYRP